jgi:excisionase family DNA binding protein
MCEQRETNNSAERLEILLRGNDVARILSISRSKAYMLIQAGDLVSVRIGSSVRVRPSDLQAFIADRVSRGTGKGY